MLKVNGGFVMEVRLLNVCRHMTTLAGVRYFSVKEFEGNVRMPFLWLGR
jgi:hypothetical protein